MLRVGLTGGIGSGKSSVAALLRELGAVVTDADLLAREVVEPGQPALDAIAREFGGGVIRPDGSLDRPALEAITDPAIAARAAQLRALVPPDRIDVYDMPLLVEHGLWVHEHLTIVVGASERVRVQRLVSQRGLPEADVRARIAAQATDEQRRAAADLWVDNDGERAVTHARVEQIWHRRLMPFDHNLRHGIRSRRPDRVALTGPDPGWAAQGTRVVARIAAALAGQGVRVDHVGSTSVPGLIAKDVIDVQVGVRRLADADGATFRDAMTGAGFLVAPDHLLDNPAPVDSPNAGRAERFYRSADPGLHVDVSVRAVGSAGHDLTLAFRDWLRARPAEREAYAAHKAHLARAHDRVDEYGEAKQAWFGTAYEKIMTWTREVDWSP